MGIYDEEILGARQQEETARRLREGIKSPEGQMVSGWYVKPSITQYMAEGLKSYFAGKQGAEAKGKYEGATKRKQEETARLLKQLEPRADVSITPEGMRQFTQQPDISTQGIVSNALNPQPQGQMTNTTYTQPDDKTRMAALLQGMAVNPEAFQGAAKMEEFNILRGDKRDAAQQSADLKREQWARDEQLRRDLANQASEDRRLIAQTVDARREQKNVPKLPTSALKMQGEELDAIGTASSINADLGAIGQQVTTGDLQLGPVKNLMAKAKNMAGVSDAQSRNLASFQATLEKLRNDTLRLNKGVQTEGDAVRAWNELLANINDPKLVSQRIGEIQKINERAANLRKMNVDVIRSNFGVEPMDTSGYQNQPAAVGGDVHSEADKILGL